MKFSPNPYLKKANLLFLYLNINSLIEIKIYKNSLDVYKSVFDTEFNDYFLNIKKF